MPSDSPFPVPDQSANLLQWAMQNPDELAELVRFINRLKALQVSITTSTAASPFSLIDSDNNALLAIPISFQAKISAPSGGGTIDTECRAALTALLTALTNVGIN